MWGKKIKGNITKRLEGMCTRVRMLQEITLIEEDLDEVSSLNQRDIEPKGHMRKTQMYP